MSEKSRNDRSRYFLIIYRFVWYVRACRNDRRGKEDKRRDNGVERHGDVVSSHEQTGDKLLWNRSLTVVVVVACSSTTCRRICWKVVSSNLLSGNPAEIARYVPKCTYFDLYSDILRSRAPRRERDTARKREERKKITKYPCRNNKSIRELYLYSDRVFERRRLFGYIGCISLKKFSLPESVDFSDSDISISMCEFKFKCSRCFGECNFDRCSIKRAYINSFRNLLCSSKDHFQKY